MPGLVPRRGTAEVVLLKARDIAVFQMMAQVMMAHGVSGCFGTTLAPRGGIAFRSFPTVTSRYRM